MDHAFKRAKDRLGIYGKGRVIRLAEVGWKRGKKFIGKLNKDGFITYQYKRLGTTVFVFQVDRERVKLLTVYKKDGEKGNKKGH